VGTLRKVLQKDLPQKATPGDFYFTDTGIFYHANEDGDVVPFYGLLPLLDCPEPIRIPIGGR
jgi:hypothetical protein